MAEILQQVDGILEFDILVNGNKIKDTVEVQEITITSEVNRIASATVVMQDGGAIGVESEPYIHSEGESFVPGAEIEIKLGHENDRESAFNGIIVSHRLMVKNGKSQLHITCKDKAVSMTKGRFNGFFQDKKDSDVMSSIAGKYSIKTAVEATSVEHKLLLQYNCSDWDYLLIRAEANNMIVLNYENSINVKTIDFGASPVAEIKASSYVKDIDLNIDGELPAGSYALTSWGDKDQENVSTTTSLSDNLGQGNLKATDLSGVLSNDTTHLYSAAPLIEAELKKWGESLVSKAILGKIQGKITVPGTTKIKSGDIIELSEYSARFNGKAFISKVTHELQEGEWFSYLEVGMPNQMNASLPDVEDLGASGLIPSIKGVQVAVVKQIHEDPDTMYRVLVTLPSFDGDGQADGIWARLTFPYSTGGAGFYFFPEVGDEVLLSFMNNDPRFPIIMGSFYNGKNKPANDPEETNQFKSIHSKSGIFIQFDDTDKILTLETPEGNSVVLDDKNKSISLTDMNGNSVILEEAGITLDSPNDINIKAGGGINLTATSAIAMESQADVTFDGLNITASAKTGFTAKGNASAELSASGQTTVKGAMVMIN